MQNLIDKEQLKDAMCVACGNRIINGYACNGENCTMMNVIDEQPTVTDIKRAEILRLCNEIEDEVTDIAFNSTHYHIRDCCEAIREYLKAIGKELTGDAETD